MKLKIISLIVLLMSSTMFFGQTLERTRFEERSLSLGGGYTNMVDTYLSPLRYSGPHVALLSECFSQMKCPSGRWFTLSLFALHGDYTTPESGSGVTVGGMADYSYTYYYEVPLSSSLARRLRLFVGPQGQLRIGGIYNLRNSNNPAQLKLGVNIAASSMAKYAFTLWNAPMSVRLQADVPLLGTAFGPDYGQSYYEIFYLGQGEGCVHVTAPHNNLSLSTQLSYDVAFRTCTVRLTWKEDLYHWHLGNQQYRMFTHTIMLGCVKNLYHVIRNEEASRHIPY